MLNFIWLNNDSSLQINDSMVLVTRLDHSWFDSDSSRKLLDNSDSKGLLLDSTRESTNTTPAHHCSTHYAWNGEIKYCAINFLLLIKSRENHVSCRALQSYNSPGDWARELFKPSADSASLVVETEKKNFSFLVGGFKGERHKWRCFWVPLPGSGLQPIGPLLWLKILSETRRKSASLEPLNDFLACL